MKHIINNVARRMEIASDNEFFDAIRDIFPKAKHAGRSTIRVNTNLSAKEVAAKLIAVGAELQNRKWAPVSAAEAIKAFGDANMEGVYLLTLDKDGIQTDFFVSADGKHVEYV